jgi:ammonia channel protein AmtB
MAPRRYGFNPGSTLNINTAATYATSGRAACCTTLAGATGCLTALALGFIRSSSWDLLAVCNGTLVGFVSITAGCAVLEPWAAIVAGVTGERTWTLAPAGAAAPARRAPGAPPRRRPAPGPGPACTCCRRSQPGC